MVTDGGTGTVFKESQDGSPETENFTVSVNAAPAVTSIFTVEDCGTIPEEKSNFDGDTESEKSLLGFGGCGKTTVTVAVCVSVSGVNGSVQVAVIVNVAGGIPKASAPAETVKPE